MTDVVTTEVASAVAPKSMHPWCLTQSQCTSKTLTQNGVLPMPSPRSSTTITTPWRSTSDLCHSMKDSNLPGKARFAVRVVAVAGPSRCSFWPEALRNEVTRPTARKEGTEVVE
jgi:hypothetical protein